MVYNGYIGGEILPKRKIKTKKTQLEAIQRYNARHDRVTLTLPAGTKNRIAQITDKSINKYIADLIFISLDKCTETKLNCIDEDTGTYTNTDTSTTNTVDIELNKTELTEQDTTDLTDTDTTDTSTIDLTEQNNVMDLFD